MNAPLLHTLALWRPITALVVGDLILDKLVFGNADRLSPDAPVPVLHVQRSEHRAGGAANVCLDLAAMRANVHAFGVTGNDADAELLRASLREAGIGVDGIISDASRPTTVKQSLIGLAQHRHPQKMFRVDHESKAPISRDVMSRLLTAFEVALATADVVCIEDYHKGVCTPELCQLVIAMARRAGVPVMVDPAAIEDYSKYRGSTTITPNRTEAVLACAGLEVDDHARPEEYQPIARRLVDTLELECAIITLDRHGALLLERGQGSVATPVPTVAREVYDVTGAGDMVLAALAAGRANGLSWLDAVRLANIAAGLEVQVFGVQPMPIEVIHREALVLERGLTHATTGQARSKVMPLQDVLVEVAAHRSTRTVRGPQSKMSDDSRIVFTNGCFDILHPGHVSLLTRARALAGEHGMLVVGVNSDDSVRRLKGPTRPVNNESARTEVLAGLQCVDAVVVFDDDTPERLIRAICPDVLVKGNEYTEDKVPGASFVRSRGGRVELLPMIAGQSTTGTIRKMQSAN